MEISAALVKELREKTGAGMMDCKKALAENGGDFEKASDWLRKKGIASAAKKAGRMTKEGTVAAYVNSAGTTGVLLEVNCETDFVARTEQFKAFVNGLCNQIATGKPANVDALMSQDFKASPGKTTQVVLQEIIATLGENMSVRRFECFDLAGKGMFQTYIHGEGKVGVLLELGGVTPASGEVVATFAKDLAMHIAAAAPQFVRPDQVSQEVITREKDIAREQIANSGKAMKPEFLEKAVDGKVRKILEEICLLSQPFVKNPDQTVDALVKETSKKAGTDIVVHRFGRFVLGDGLKESAES